MKFMLNGALTLEPWTVQMWKLLKKGEEKAFIFGLISDEVINYENNGGYYPMEFFNSDQEIRRVLMQLINGYFAPHDPELFRAIYILC